jgi:predicted ATPase with chaperone activity
MIFAIDYYQKIICLNLSARSYGCTLKLARTIADLAEGEKIQFVHLAGVLHAARSPEVNNGMKEGSQSIFRQYQCRDG